MLKATGSVRCVFLVVVSLLLDFSDCVPMGYQTLGTIISSTRRTPLMSFTKTVQRGKTRLEPFSDFLKWDWARLELLASPKLSRIQLRISP